MKTLITILLLFTTLLSIGQVCSVNEGGTVTKFTDSINVANSTNSVTLGYRSALRVAGNTTVWDDLRGGVNRNQSGINNYPTFVEDSVYLSFSIDSTSVNKNVAFLEFQMPHDYKEGTRIYPHVHYRHTTGQGTPVFVWEKTWVNLGDVSAIAWTKHVTGTTTGTTDGTSQLVGDSGIDGTGMHISSIIKIHLWLRSTSGATKTCFVESIDIHYEKDAIGSNTISTKD